MDALLPTWLTESSRRKLPRLLGQRQQRVQAYGRRQADVGIGHRQKALAALGHGLATELGTLLFVRHAEEQGQGDVGWQQGEEEPPARQATEQRRQRQQGGKVEVQQEVPD